MDSDTMQMNYITKMSVRDNLTEHLICEELWNDIKKLPEIYSDIFMMYAFEEYSLEEISKILDLKPATVRKRIQRGREILEKTKVKDKYYK